MSKLIFMGTSDFAARCLQSLKEDNIDIDLVITPPDRPGGRKLKLLAPPVKVWAIAAGMPVWQPENINSGESVARLKQLKPDLVVVVAYGKILRQAVLDIPPLGCINVHASLLPDLRGAAPIQWALLKGYTRTGVTTMYIDQGLDTGDIILQQPVAIEPEDDAGTLHQRLGAVAGPLLVKTVRLIQSGRAPRQPQPPACPQFAPVLARDIEKIDWHQSAPDIVNLVRALAPQPGAWTLFRGKRLKILRARAVPGHLPPGQIRVEKNRMLTGCGQDLVELVAVQPAGKRRMAAPQFLSGYRVEEGEIFQ